MTSTCIPRPPCHRFAMQSTAPAKRLKERIVPSRYMQHQTTPLDDKENTTRSDSQHTTTKPPKPTSTTSASSSTLACSATTAASITKPAALRASRAALSTLPGPANNRNKSLSAAVSQSSAVTLLQSSATPTENIILPPTNSRRRTHDIADHPPVSAVSHRSSLTLHTPLPSVGSLPAAARPQLSDVSLHCYQTALLQSHYWHAAVERAHIERREAAERQLGAVAAVVRSRLSEERQCQQRIARIQQSEADHYSLAAQHTAITPLLPLIQRATEVHDEMCELANTIKAQLRLDGVAVDVDELTAELSEAQRVLDEINKLLLESEHDSPSLASSLSALSPSLSRLFALLADCAPALSGTSSTLASLQDRVERESSVAFGQVANSSEAERHKKRQELGGRWQW